MHLLARPLATKRTFEAAIPPVVRPRNKEKKIGAKGVILRLRLDAISWRWTTSGMYMTTSAYKCQFSGSVPHFRSSKVWTANAEPKCRFFAWLVLHGKILTTDNFAIRGWPHDPICKLCHIHPETIQHLLF